ncbi:Aldehyde dehydrogenase N-terminal [Penicillium samsonianum]|uniref:Aldehyde dehydrogenase N-terminal n=1 Tax=Penicillium samsonianum TaxID=1882272 RepID=UPI002548E021|nr:Aldehyde dehydrogenase N-terminal [Penicillium samsonianum]KAJ6138957.1 Aldehyde dehydrogenase N-terminal [Penicillium samsonianum]
MPKPGSEDLYQPGSIHLTFVPGISPDCHYRPHQGNGFHETESFGPVVGIVTVESEAQIIEIAEQANYGLPASIISSNHYRALKLSESIKA